MDIKVHNQILWQACLRAQADGGLVDDPREYFPLMVRGSWMNDVNQTTIFTNKLNELTSDKVEPEFQRFLKALWNAEKDDLLTEMHAGPSPARDAHDRAEYHLDTIPGDSIGDFGAYSRYDHLDVIKKDEAKSELDAFISDPLKRSKTIQEMVAYITTRLHTAAILGSAERFEWAKLTAFGKALHTIGDFYAHSNFVELLLWSLSWRKLIPEALIAEFNDPVDFLRPERYARWSCPLPPSGQTAMMTMHQIMFWYEDSPEATPLVSTLFDATDTVVSLLDLWASNLEVLDDNGHDERMLDILLSVVKFPGILKAGWKIAQGYKDLFESIGKAVRDWMANQLDHQSTKFDPSVQAFVKVGTQLLRKYNSKTAGEWARAGRLRYLSATLKRQLASELDEDNRFGQPYLLPHHSILQKDYPPNRFDDLIRFRLACALATGLTGRLIRWYFSPNPVLSQAQTILEGAICHPWNLLKHDSSQAMARLAEQAASRSWTRIAPQ